MHVLDGLVSVFIISRKKNFLFDLSLQFLSSLWPYRIFMKITLPIAWWLSYTITTFCGQVVIRGQLCDNVNTENDFLNDVDNVRVVISFMVFTVGYKNYWLIFEAVGWL